MKFKWLRDKCWHETSLKCMTRDLAPYLHFLHSTYTSDIAIHLLNSYLTWQYYSLSRSLSLILIISYCILWIKCSTAVDNLYGLTYYIVRYNIWFIRHKDEAGREPRHQQVSEEPHSFIYISYIPPTQHC